MLSTDSDLQKKLAAMTENWNHARHVENERLQFTQIYGGIVAGVLAISNAFNTPISQNILWILFLIGSVGFILSVKLTYEFKNHISKVEELFEDKILKKHVGIQLSGGVFSLIKVRYMILIFYTIMCCFILYLLVDSRWIILQISLMISLVVFSDIEFQKRQKIRELSDNDDKKKVEILKNLHFWDINTLHDEIKKTKLIEKILEALSLSEENRRKKYDELKKLKLKQLNVEFKKILCDQSNEIMSNINSPKK